MSVVTGVCSRVCLPTFLEHMAVDGRLHGSPGRREPPLQPGGGGQGWQGLSGLQGSPLSPGAADPRSCPAPRGIRGGLGARRGPCCLVGGWGTYPCDCPEIKGGSQQHPWWRPLHCLARFHLPLRAGPSDVLKAELNQRILFKICTRCCCFSALTGEAFGSAVSFFLSFLFFFFYSCLKKEFGCLAQLALITLCTGNKIACVINF